MLSRLLLFLAVTAVALALATTGAGADAGHDIVGVPRPPTTLSDPAATVPGPAGVVVLLPVVDEAGHPAVQVTFRGSVSGTVTARGESRDFPTGTGHQPLTTTATGAQGYVPVPGSGPWTVYVESGGGDVAEASVVVPDRVAVPPPATVTTDPASGTAIALAPTVSAVAPVGDDTRSRVLVAALGAGVPAAALFALATALGPRRRRG